MPSRFARASLRTFFAVAVVALVATACAGSDDTSSPPASRGVSATDRVISPEEKPVPGGTLTYGLEAETDGFNPISNRWAISGTMIGFAVYDPLAAYNADSEIRPYLAEAFEPNDDFTVWTIRLREGVTYHNGTPLNAEALKAVLEAHRASLLSAPVFAPVESVTVVDDLTLDVQMSGPWVAFPASLTSQAGVVPEPSTLDGDGSEPIGTGPFVQESWNPNVEWKGAKYDGYWRTDEDGVQLPYLDEVVFRPVPDPDARAAALQTGELDMMHTSTARTIKAFRDLADAGEIQLIEDRGEGEERFIIINTRKPPLDDVTLRRALAAATNVDTFASVIEEDVPEKAMGPFTTRSPWYAETPDYPTYDPAAATALVEEWKAANGGQAPTITMKVDQTEQRAAELLAEMWTAAGFDVQIVGGDQATNILDAVTGEYQVQLWRQFGSPDPDADWIWWHSENAGDGPEGGLALNIARHQSDCVDQALVKGRENADVEVRREAYAELQACFAESVPYIWLIHTVWAVAAQNDVRGITNGPLPDGEPSLPIGGAGDFGGVTRLTQTWLAS